WRQLAKTSFEALHFPALPVASQAGKDLVVQRQLLIRMCADRRTKLRESIGAIPAFEGPQVEPRRTADQGEWRQTAAEEPCRAIGRTTQPQPENTTSQGPGAADDTVVARPI